MRVLRFLVDLLWPPRCPLCDGVIGFAQECGECGGQAVARLRRGVPLVEKQGHVLEHLEGAFAPFWYEDPVDKTILRMKRQARVDLVAFCAQEMLRVLRKQGIPCPQLIIPVPPGRKQAIRRGKFDAPLRMASMLARGLEVPLCSDALYKAFDTQPQHLLTAPQRRINLLGAFAVTDEGAPQLAGKRVLLVDDVLTTGSTLNECAKTLRAFGVSECWGICAAVTQTPGQT